jgi:predicted ATPase/DNA-binding CsgD family transcriptional regulator
MPLSRLVGREREIAEITQLLEGNRLVTLVGAGGVGKTRLAIEEAALMTPRFPDGVGLVDLSGVADPALLWAAVARMIGVEERADADLVPRVMRILRPQRRLLVLDNCEHLVAASAAAATQLLGFCPELRILATGRAGLGVPGEIHWRVPSLTFPWPEHPPSLEQLDSFGAISLFIDRARAARPGLVIRPADVGALSLICFRLDGIPLALELAAARVSALTIGEIAERLDDRFALLNRGAGGPARHQTLRASVEWSHQLLSEPERALLRRLAIFAGSWSLGAAEAVCTGPPVEPGQGARLLAALVDKSLVQAEDSPTGTRYRMLEAIKAFAAEQLALRGELDAARARHGTYFAELGERTVSRLHGKDQGLWAWRIDQEQANFRAARLWCAADPGRAEVGLRMASGLWEYWLIRGLLEEGAAWLHDVLQRAAGPPAARADALTGLAVMSSLRGDSESIGDLFAVSIALYERVDDRQGQARALAILGFWLASQADFGPAAQTLERAWVLAEQSPDRYFAAFALLMAAMAAPMMGNTPLAKTHAVHSMRLFTEIGDSRGAGYARCVLAECLINDGAPAEGLAILRACTGVFEALVDRWGLLVSAGSMALAHAALGDWAQAAFVLGVAESLNERIGGQPFPGVQAAVDAVAAKTAAELGAETTFQRQAGRAAGRGERIAAALGAARETASQRLPQQQEVLTPRENEITDLIAAGMTNRQIAERLFIAQRTVDTHVGHILAKLGCSNRSQVAALAGPAGLLRQGTDPKYAHPVRRFPDTGYTAAVLASTRK